MPIKGVMVQVAPASELAKNDVPGRRETDEIDLRSVLGIHGQKLCEERIPT